MASNTSLLGLRKPTDDDEVNVELDISDNMQKIDNWLEDNVIQRSKDIFVDYVAKGLLPSTTQDITVQDCESLWNESPIPDEIEMILDVNDKQKGGASLRFNIDAGFTGIIATKNILPVDLSKSSSIKLWIKSEYNTEDGEYTLLLDNSPRCESPLKELSIPALSAFTWTQVNLDLGDASLLTSIISVGIKKTKNTNERTIRIDDIKAVLLSSTISSGVAYINGHRIVVPAKTVEFSANCDTYLFLNQEGSITSNEVAIGGIEPSVPLDSIKLARVRTSSNYIESVLDLRNTNPVHVTPTIDNESITEEKLASGSVSSVKIKSAAVTSSKIASDTINTYHIKDLVVTGDKIAEKTITNEKIQDATIRLGNGNNKSKVGKIDAEFHVFQTHDVPNYEVAISHGLGRVPIGYVLVRSSQPLRIYDGDTAWTDSHIFLRSDVVNAVVTVIVF